MNKMRLSIFALAAALALSACGDKNNDNQGPASDYSVTVTKDAGGNATANPATAKAGTEVTLSASPESGFKFTQWTVVSGNVILADKTENPAKFIMPAFDVEVKAEFLDVLGNKFQVGDYWPDPKVVYKDKVVQSGTTAQGIVFWLDTSDADYSAASDGFPAVGKKGKIFSLDMSADKLQWGPDKDEHAAGVTGIRSWADGYTATKNLIAKYGSTANFANNYAAFDWIYKKNGSKQGPWYMPASSEASSVFNLWGLSSGTPNQAQADLVNAKITAAGGVDCTSPRRSMWASTESYNNMSKKTVAPQVSINGLSAEGSSKVGATDYVRACAAFSDGDLLAE